MIGIRYEITFVNQITISDHSNAIVRSSALRICLVYVCLEKCLMCFPRLLCTQALQLANSN